MGENIRLTAKDGFELGAYVARPAGTPKGAIVDIQEIFGVNQHMRADTDRYAAAGYLAISPQLYDRVEPNVELGYTGDEPKKGMDIRAKTEMDKVMMDIQAAIDHVKGAGKVGVVGYCWGGTLVFASAVNQPDVSAAVAYYGGGVPDMADQKPKCPTMMHFGDQDHGIPMDKVKTVQDKRGGDCEIHVYEGAGHGFNCDERASWNEDAAKLAAQRSLDFFGKHLG
ncbi:MAG: dienelactone hydrolase family protein [Hyphomicrobiales bacterium]|nr:dienelactone hydrolase family protein [Hyphomicrobiales bacterium]